MFVEVIVDAIALPREAQSLFIKKYELLTVNLNAEND